MLGPFRDDVRWLIRPWLHYHSRYYQVKGLGRGPHDWLTGLRVAAKESGFGYCKWGPWYRQYGTMSGFIELAEPVDPSAAPRQLVTLYEDSNDMQQSEVVAMDVEMTQGGIAPTSMAAGSSTAPAPSARSTPCRL